MPVPLFHDTVPLRTIYTSLGTNVFELPPYPSLEEFIATLALATGTSGAAVAGAAGALGGAYSPAQAELSITVAARIMMRVDRVAFAIVIGGLERCLS
jgi:hypothetical protein